MQSSEPGDPAGTLVSFLASPLPSLALGADDFKTLVDVATTSLRTLGESSPLWLAEFLMYGHLFTVLATAQGRACECPQLAGAVLSNTVET